MNQFSNYLSQYQTKKVFSIYQHQCNSKSPQIRKQFDSNPQSSPNDQKYLRQFKCQDLSLNQHQTIINSPQNKYTLISNKTKGKENNNLQNTNINSQLQKNHIETKSPQNFKQNPYNVKQPTPEFENRYESDEKEPLQNSGLNFRFVNSQQESEKQESKKEQLDIKINNGESSKQYVNNFFQTDELLVDVDSVRKSRFLNQTKSIAIQAFESKEFEKPQDQLNKIFGSLKKIKIIKKKYSQTQGTQRTMEEDDSVIKIETSKQIKTIGGLSNIDIQSMQLRTEFTDLDSQRSKSSYQDERDIHFCSFRNNVVTPKKMQQNKISFLMYKKKLERKQ
ncbi:unnamed protein product [Paramecium sonneborni]|uniref:Uncharacterized protein n=1 Tax=Paramecium sonneborni TaxID=65129 RepID=A0A8S1R9S6_9CILI|nr:unnamed protein product [Paramecium sonneborni]